MVTDLPILKIGAKITDGGITGNSQGIYYLKEITYVGKLLEIKKPSRGMWR